MVPYIKHFRVYVNLYVVFSETSFAPMMLYIAYFFIYTKSINWIKASLCRHCQRNVEQCCQIGLNRCWNGAHTFRVKVCLWNIIILKLSWKQSTLYNQSLNQSCLNNYGKPLRNKWMEATRENVWLELFN